MNPIIQKIRKLLALAGNNTSAAEAAAALAKAQKLATDNGISLTEVCANDGPAGTGGIQHRTVKTLKGLHEKLAEIITKQHFGVQMIIESGGGRSTLYIIGNPCQAEIATYVYTYLSRALASAWLHRTNQRLKNRQGFMMGFCAAISQLLPEVFPQTGLVVSIDSYIENHLMPPGAKLKEPKQFKPKRVSKTAARAGYQAGEKAGIRNSIRGTASQQLLDF